MINWEKPITIIENKEKCKSILLENGVKIYEIEGKKTLDEPSLEKEIVSVLPQNPLLKINGSLNLDGLADSLWGGIADELEYNKVNKVALIWKDADYIIENNINRFLDILDVFIDVRDSISTTKFGLLEPIKFKVYLVVSEDSLCELTKILSQKYIFLHEN